MLGRLAYLSCLSRLLDIRSVFQNFAGSGLFGLHREVCGDRRHIPRVPFTPVLRPFQAGIGACSPIWIILTGSAVIPLRLAFRAAFFSNRFSARLVFFRIRSGSVASRRSRLFRGRFFRQWVIILAGPSPVLFLARGSFPSRLFHGLGYVIEREIIGRAARPVVGSVDTSACSRWDRPFHGLSSRGGGQTSSCPYHARASAAAWLERYGGLSHVQRQPSPWGITHSELGSSDSRRSDRTGNLEVRLFVQLLGLHHQIAYFQVDQYA